MQIGHVINTPNPKVIRPTTNVTTIMIMPPRMVEYNIPNGPNKKVRISDMPILFGEDTMMC